MLKMKALRALRTLTVLSPKSQNIPLRFYAAQPQEDDPTHNPSSSDTENGSDSVFDSAHFALPSFGSDAKTRPQAQVEPTWDKKYRERADRVVFVEETQKGKLRIKEEEEEERRRRVLAKALLEAALEKADEEEDLVVKQEDQKSLTVGIVGAPNAGKSSLTNYVVCLCFGFFHGSIS